MATPGPDRDQAWLSRHNDSGIFLTTRVQVWEVFTILKVNEKEFFILNV